MSSRMRNGSVVLACTVVFGFTTDATGGDVLSLTLINLKRPFPTNHQCHDSLDALAGVGGLEHYDDSHKMFEVNRLLEATEGPLTDAK